VHVFTLLAFYANVYPFANVIHFEEIIHILCPIKIEDDNVAL